MYDVGPPTRRREDGGTREEGGGKPQLRTDLEGGISPDIFTGNIQGLREFATSGKRKETNYIKMKGNIKFVTPNYRPFERIKKQMLAAPVGDDEENTPMLVRDSESNTPMLVRDSESTTASGTNQTAQPPRRKIGRCLVRYAAVLPVLFIYMWALLGEEEVRRRR